MTTKNTKPESKSTKPKTKKAKTPKLNRDVYHNSKGKFKVGNPGRPKGSLGKFTAFRKALMNSFEAIGGEDAILNYLSQNIVYKDGVPVSMKYDKNGKEEIIEINSGRFELLLNLMAKTTPKTEIGEDEEEGNSYEARMNKVDQQLKSNPDLKNKLLEELIDEA